MAYATPEVQTTCVTIVAGKPCVRPSIFSASNKSYPIARPLFVYSKESPSGAIKSYLDWILSDEGQCIILDKGYAPARTVTCS